MRANPNGPRGDFVIEFNTKGEIVWQWGVNDHADLFASWDPKKRDPTHMNSVRELGSNPAFDAGDERFRPDNLLLSARNLDTIFVIDRKSGEVVWQFSEGLDYQHEPLMLPPGHPHAGKILLFN